MAIRDWVQNEFLRTYLDYTERTEPPKIMHLWSAISGVSACMARHTWLETGIEDMYANMYVLLVGPPGVRKSTAIRNVRKLIEQSTAIRFAPDDTGGQRQGLIAAIEGRTEGAVSEDTEALLENAFMVGDLETVGQTQLSTCLDDKYAMYASISEFGSFIGQNSLDLTRFLIKMWDNESYDYQLKSSMMKLENAQLSFIAGTTASDISSLLPPEAIGQGFMSRIVLVFAPEKYEKIPASKAFLKHELADNLKETFAWAFNTMRGPMRLSQAAQVKEENIYMQEFRINDTRFMYYAERRHSHLLKLAMTLAAMRRSMIIETDDVEQADVILSATEETMPDALGEYGLSPIANAKQKMAEFIQHAKGPVTHRVLWMVMQRDMRMVDFRNAISDMVNAGKITQIDSKLGMAFIYNDSAQQALDILAEDSDLLEDAI